MIYFNVREVREYLVTHGEVYTIRNPRSEGTTDAVHGNYRKQTKICRVQVELVTKNITSIDQLVDYAFKSGITVPITLSAFKPDARQIATKWLDLAHQLSGQNGETLHLYHVIKMPELNSPALLTTPFFVGRLER